jgi:hypothetical protein
MATFVMYSNFACLWLFLLKPKHVAIKVTCNLVCVCITADPKDVSVVAGSLVSLRNCVTRKHHLVSSQTIEEGLDWEFLFKSNLETLLYFVFGERTVYCLRVPGRSVRFCWCFLSVELV